jgi:hypothetical protein
MKKTDPQPSPAMAGGLFSMHREYFFDMGAFDEGMMHWYVFVLECVGAWIVMHLDNSCRVEHTEKREREGQTHNHLPRPHILYTDSSQVDTHMRLPRPTNVFGNSMCRGGENIEIGFRVWQCGGSIELMSCSRIGHVWGGMGSNCGWKGPAPTDKNKWRAIEVWMDKCVPPPPVPLVRYTVHVFPSPILPWPPFFTHREHQDIMRQFLPYPKEGTGDLSKMVAIREKYKCKSFAWFLETVYPECWMNVLAKAKRQGVLKSVDHGTCIDTRAPGGLKMVPCITSEHHSGQPNTQIMYQTGDHELIPNA